MLLEDLGLDSLDYEKYIIKNPFNLLLGDDKVDNPKDSNNPIILDVGGNQMKTTAETLRKVKGSKLARLCA